MIRTTALSLLLFWAVAVSSFSRQAFVLKRSTDVAKNTMLASLNTLAEIKENYSGPNMMSGTPDLPSSSMPAPTAAPSISEFKVGQLAVADFATPGSKLAPGADPVGTRKPRWVTAVFWSELDLYGHTIATSK